MTNPYAERRDPRLVAAMGQYAPRRQPSAVQTYLDSVGPTLAKPFQDYFDRQGRLAKDSLDFAERMGPALAKPFEDYFAHQGRLAREGWDFAERMGPALANPFEDYFARQGRRASEGWAVAERGAQQVRGGDLSGLAGLVLGPMGYFASPISALLPTADEVYNSNLPDWAAPAVAGMVEAMAMGLPGPKGLPKARSGVVSPHAPGPNAGEAIDATNPAFRVHPADSQGSVDQMQPGALRPWAKPNVQERGNVIATPMHVREVLEDAGLTPDKVDASNSLGSLSQYIFADGKDGRFKVRVSDHNYLAPEYGADIRYGEAPDEIERKIKTALGLYEPWRAPDRFAHIRPEIETWAARLGMNPNLKDVKDAIGKAIETNTPTRRMAEWTRANEGITAYHGSPHTFDKIGTGEGAQALVNSTPGPT